MTAVIQPLDIRCLVLLVSLRVPVEWINFLNGAIILGALVVSRIASGKAQV